VNLRQERFWGMDSREDGIWLPASKKEGHYLLRKDQGKDNPGQKTWGLGVEDMLKAAAVAPRIVENPGRCPNLAEPDGEYGRGKRC